MAINELEKFLRADYEKWRDIDYLHEMVDGKYIGITFGEFIEKVNYLATYLIDNGYKDKHIGIYSPNSLAWMIADVAIMNYVGLSIGLNKDWKDDNLDYAINKCEIDLMLYSKLLEDKINAVKPKHPGVEFICIEDEFERMLDCGKASCKELFALDPVDEDKPAKIVFTSGSTSFPKAVMLSIKNIYASYEALGRRIQVDENDICYLFLPLNHTYGSIFNFLYSLVFGFKIYLNGDIKNMAQEMMMVKPTIFCAVPLVCVKFVDASKAMNVPLKMILGGKIRYLFIGGSCLPYDIRQAFIDQGMNPQNAYALSETSSGFSIDYPDVTDMDSAGTLLEYVDAKVIDPDEDGIGELAIKGPNVFAGYLNDPQATEKAFDKDGYFLTGDLGKIVGTMVYVKGRKDTMLVLINGENVSSKRICDKVKEADPRIVSVKAYIRDEMLTCDIFVKSKADMEGDWQVVIDKVNEGLSKYEKIRHFSVMDIAALLKG
ncbi:MAG: AMP-binding protein [Saccharofermentans sp.]|nr:AMP-binding protein [Saccharofermentans sp.]